jgi:hypothetical protein
MEEFNQVLNEWKDKYVQYITTGDENDKQAYESAQSAIEQTLSAKRARVEREQADMKQFANSYAKSNADLANTVDNAKSLVDNAAVLHDQYVTSKNRFDTWTESPTAPAKPTPDVSNGYAIVLRVGIFLILLPILLFVGYLVPGVAQTLGAPGTSITLLSPALSPQT